jgi:hypothetical protein
MPALLCPSPVILDQSFPRSVEELRIVAVALGELQASVEKRQIQLVLTGVLQQIAEDIEWQRPVGQYPLLVDIHRLIVQLFLQPHQGLIAVRFPERLSVPPHPVYSKAIEGPRIETWCEELGQLLLVHNETRNGGPYYIGIACEHCFAGVAETDHAAAVGHAESGFPAVGPKDVGTLADAYYRHTPEDIHAQSVSFRQAKKNCRILGATAVLKPAGGSHYKVVFPNAPRPWPLDSNVDPIPDRFLAQLESISGFEKSVVIAALVTGELPQKRLKMCRSRLCVVACGVADCRGSGSARVCPHA